jgi:hypothetical protein
MNRKKEKGKEEKEKEGKAKKENNIHYLYPSVT